MKHVELLWLQQHDAYLHDAYLSEQILVSCSAQHQLLSEKSHFCLKADREMKPRKNYNTASIPSP